MGHKKPRQQHYFLFAFLSSVSVLVVILAALLGYHQFQKNAQDATTRVSDIPKTPATASENLTILVMGSKTKTDTADTYLLVKIDAVQSMFYLSAIPNTLEATVNTKTDTLSGHFAYAGKQQAVQAVEHALGITIDRYIHLTKDSFIKLMDLVGGLEYYVPENLLYVDPQQGLDINLRAGVQQLDGRRLYDLLTYPDYTLRQRQNLTNTLAQSILNDRLVPSTIRILDTIYYTMINDIDCNLTFYDYTLRKDILETIANTKLKVKIMDLVGQTDVASGRFVATQSATRAIRLAF